ncbi:bifunctional DNA primase/polymerase [bacterium]|nr:bifunctional DNA primase/polymerase [bacterium]
MKRSPEELIELLKVPAVFIPIPSGRKGPTFKNWQNTTFEKSKSEDYQRRLESHRNTGVLLGSPSANLVSIDFDDAEFSESFLNRNPWHTKTLRTNSKRGFNLWLVMQGDYPERVLDLKSGAKKDHVGEWRGGGGALTILQGIHPEKVPYKITQEHAPLRLKFEQIDFGDALPQCPINGINNIKNINDISEGRERKGEATLNEKINRVQKATKALKNDANLWSLYTEFIDRRYLAEQGQRNSQLVAMTTFLAFNTSDEITLRLVNSFYDLNEDVFTDAKSTHSSEARSQLENVNSQWLENLTQRERILVDGLPERHREAFKILKNLAKIDAADSPVGIFYLSCKKFGIRLGVDCKEGYRIFNQFKALGVISVLEKGEKYRLGTKAKASFYKWLLD